MKRIPDGISREQTREKKTEMKQMGQCARVGRPTGRIDLSGTAQSLDSSSVLERSQSELKHRA